MTKLLTLTTAQKFPPQVLLREYKLEDLSVAEVKEYFLFASGDIKSLSWTFTPEQFGKYLIFFIYIEIAFLYELRYEK